MGLEEYDAAVASTTICSGRAGCRREWTLRSGGNERSAICRRGGTTPESLRSAACAPVLACERRSIIFA